MFESDRYERLCITSSLLPADHTTSNRFKLSIIPSVNTDADDAEFPPVFQLNNVTRWKLAAVPQHRAAEPGHDSSMTLNSVNHDRADAGATATATLYDWTESLPQTDHVRFFRNVDWSRTALGPTVQWGTALRMYTHMIMSDSRAATLYW